MAQIRYLEVSFRIPEESYGSVESHACYAECERLPAAKVLFPYGRDISSFLISRATDRPVQRLDDRIAVEYDVNCLPHGPEL